MRKFTILLFCALIAFSCSSDDDNNEGNNNTNNALTFNGTSFNVSNVFLNDENTTDNNPSDIAIIMSNINLLTESQPNGVNYVYFDFPGVELQTGTITNISDYTILENASFVDSEIDSGNTILDDAENGFMATNTILNINSLSPSQIDFNFSFTREDGEIITGNYSGNYTDISQ
ncbi:hypothetical protein [Winogradskyella sp. SM1960]|uniref:hypothetical protein n=1 Tax=Winogradskyella sp. SM1960 TaxID=2865955 RepID=UPI001CD370E5|nr:hypothetical protein [Winogradskyella sp. SM1960]